MAHKNTISLLARDSMRNYISKILNMYWPEVKNGWENMLKHVNQARKSGLIPEKRKQFKNLSAQNNLRGIK